MSAGFKFADCVYWGTMGVIETCVETLCQQSGEKFGFEDPFTGFFSEQRATFQTGMTGIVVYLDEILTDYDSRHRFIQLWDATERQIKGSDKLTEHGLKWLEYTTAELKAAILNADNQPKMLPQTRQKIIPK